MFANPSLVNTNRGLCYLVYYSPSAAHAAIAHMHEGQLDGATINVSIVLPRRSAPSGPASGPPPRGPPPQAPRYRGPPGGRYRSPPLRRGPPGTVPGAAIGAGAGR